MTAVFSYVRKSPVLRNFSILTASNIFSQLLSILTSIKVARILEPAIYGTYNLLQLHTSIFVIIASIGLKNIVVRTVARDKGNSKKVFLISLLIRIIGIVFSLIAYTIYFYYSKGYGGFLFFLTLASITISAFYDLIEGVAFGLEKMEFTGIISLANNIVWVIIILLIPKQYFNLDVLFSVFVGLNLLKTLVYIFSIYKFNYFTGDFSGHNLKYDLKEMTRDSMPYYYLAILTLLSNQIPVLFLEHRSGVAEVAYYNVANKVLSPMSLILNTALTALFPNLAKLFVADRKGFSERIKNIFLIMSLLGIIGAFGVTFFLKEIILIIYGEKYLNTSLVLGYQCWYMAIYSLVCLIGTVLGVIDRQKQLSRLSIICTLLQVPILWVGAKYGAEYLSLSFLIATAISLLFHIATLKRFLKHDLSYSFFIKIIALFALAYVVSISVLRFNLGIKILLFTGISIFGVYILYRKYKVVKA
ncbi:oligosaccharide flippase family protein [Filimonas effusa]|uniref:Polysaccharide biosynthesis protein n=1 Tax=Filimonas effusa TaxID=2508721 RepID=A0A4Q1DD82_9BACT|nr:oligosaccharide flippase family protein [Filimonas effusa]RXK87350.1 hypothetical protein ESB13_11395 [Filimonas effusa]